MKKIICLAMFILLFGIIGCKGEKLEVINDSKIFDQVDNSYYVYFFSDSCAGCETVKPLVLTYQKQAKNDNSKLPLYSVNLFKEKENASIIYREYKDADGQGTDGYFFVDGVTKWGRLYIGTTPSLIRITTVNGVKEASYIGQGISMSEYLNDLI